MKSNEAVISIWTEYRKCWFSKKYKVYNKVKYLVAYGSNHNWYDTTETDIECLVKCGEREARHIDRVRNRYNKYDYYIGDHRAVIKWIKRKKNN